MKFTFVRFYWERQDEVNAMRSSLTSSWSWIDANNSIEAQDICSKRVLESKKHSCPGYWFHSGVLIEGTVQPSAEVHNFTRLIWHNKEVEDEFDKFTEKHYKEVKNRYSFQPKKIILNKTQQKIVNLISRVNKEFGQRVAESFVD